MTFDDAITVLRGWLHEEVLVSISTPLDGSSEYVADFSGRLIEVIDPIPGVDDPVVYFRWADRAAGLGVHAALFKRAAWKTAGDQTSLEIDCGSVLLDVATTAARP